MHITLIKPLCFLHKKRHIKNGYPNIVIYNFLKIKEINCIFNCKKALDKKCDIRTLISFF